MKTPNNEMGAPTKRTQPKGRNPKGLRTDYSTTGTILEVLFYAFVIILGLLAVLMGDL